MASTIRGSDNFDSGSVGSTTFGDVGTYTTGMFLPGAYPNGKTGGYTISGSSLRGWTQVSGTSNSFAFFNSETNTSNLTSPSFSGTWRLMSPYAQGSTSNRYVNSFWVRIS